MCSDCSVWSRIGYNDLVMGKCRIRKAVRESFENAVANIEEERYGFIYPYVALDERISKLDDAIASLIDYKNDLERVRENEERELLRKQLYRKE